MLEQRGFRLGTRLSVSHLMGVWTWLGRSKFEGLTLFFFRCKSKGGGGGCGSTLTLSARRRPYGVYMCYVKGYSVGHSESMGR